MGRVVHFEIHADDPERAVAFYSNVFGWTVSRWGENPYWMIETGPRDEPGIDGGLMERQGEVDGTAVIAFVCTVDVLPISVAALMRARWIARRIEVPAGTSRVMVPGFCSGDLSLIEEAAGVEVVRGPKDLRQLPEFFGQVAPRGDGCWDIEIVAEINHCPQLTVDEILERAEALSSQELRSTHRLGG